MKNNLPTVVPSRGSLTPLKITLIYGCIGALWILFSDELLAYFVHDQTTLIKLGVIKGWLYVFITALLLYVLIRRNNSMILQEERKAEHLNIVLRTIREVNSLLIKEKGSKKLLKSVCNSLVENRGYYNAWIALLDGAGVLLDSAEAGLGKDFFPITRQMQSGKLTECAQKALGQSEVVLIQDPSSACTYCPLSKRYSGKSGMAIQLEHRGQVYGVFAVSISRDLIQNEQEHDLFKELADDIALALHTIALKNDHTRIEGPLQKSVDELGERTKELNCLFAISQLVEDQRLSLKQILQGTVDLIPAAWKYPQITCARILLGDEEYKTGDFEKTKWRQFSDIIVQGESNGLLEVCYLQEKSEEHEGPFLEEESRLINAIAERLGKIIERVQTQEALQKSEKRFRDLVENSLTGISIIRDDQVVYQNPEQERLLGLLPRSPKFTDIKNIHPDDIEKTNQFYENIISGKVQSREIDFRFYRSDKNSDAKNIVWVNCRTNRIEYQGKEAILVNLIDITRGKELEHLLKIQDKMTSLGRVAAGIAHEIRNPLSGINIYLNTLEKIYNKKGSLEKVGGIIGQIQSASRKIESVIKRVMDFSKPGAPKFVWIDINRPIEDAISLSSTTLRKKGVKIEKILGDDTSKCHMDPQLMELVILNLITNAAESMKNIDGDKKIEVTSSIKKGATVLVTVSDSGPGVPEDLQDKIFDPFYTTKEGGTGIGLSLCHRIISDHGGSFALSKSELGGAQFTIEIPVEKGTQSR